MIVTPGNAKKITLFGFYPKTSTGSLVLTKNGGGQVTIPLSLRGSFSEFVLPALTSGELPATADVKVDNVTVKIIGFTARSSETSVDLSPIEERLDDLEAVGSTIPAYAAPRSNPWNNDLTLYNANDVVKRQVRAALAHAFNGSTLVPILCVGDSETAGWKGTPGTDDPVTTLRNCFKASAFPVTNGWLFPNNGTTTSDNRITFSGTWSGRTSTSSNYVWASAQNSYVQFAPDQTGTVAEFAVFCTSTQNIDYSIDGGAPVTVSVVAGALRKFQVTGLANTIHTIRVTKTAPSGTLWVGAARVRTTNGLSISNAGIFGAFANDWLPSAMTGVYYNPYNLCNGLETPKIVIIGLGANEALNGGTPSVVATRLTTIVQAYQALGACVILKTYMPPADSLVTTANPGFVWTNYVKVMYDVADTCNVLLIDHTNSFGDVTATKAAGLMHTDNIHPLGPGYTAVARRDHRALISL